MPPRMRDRIGKIEVETGHLVQMVNEILDLSRIEQGGPIPSRRRRLARVAQASAERLQLFADRQGVDRVEVERRRSPRSEGTRTGLARSSSTCSTTQ